MNERPREAPARLPVLLPFTLLNSASAGAATTGIFFLTKSAFGFGELQNYSLGLLLGITYVLGALFAGPAVRALQRSFPSLTPRRIVAGIVIAAALLCLLPVAAAGTPFGPAAVFAMIAFYAPLTGVLWPMVESYLSGGRRAGNLRSAVGRFNMTWSGALFLAFWAMAPLVEERPLGVLAGLAAVHLASLALLRLLPEAPARHVENHEPHPPIYVRLLFAHRILLAAGYVVMFALSPYLPTLLGRLGVRAALETPFASIWLLARVATFFAMERWHGWHGRWSVAVWGSALLLLGFGLAVMAPDLAAPPLALALLGLGLAGFGVGIASLYSAALYYALEVGSAEVDAGGKHEALIGVGYTVGPLCGLFALLLEHRGLIAPEAKDPAMLLAVAGACGIAVLAAWRGSLIRS